MRSDQIETLVDIAIQAGEEILRFYQPEGFGDTVERKEDGSPVTQADRAAEVIIKSALSDLDPSIPFIGEETVEAGNVPDIESCDRFWCVDPLDGTKEFLSGSSEFTVNIALIENRQPSLGVVYLPVSETLYFGNKAAGAFKQVKGTVKQPIRVNAEIDDTGVKVIASRSHSNDFVLRDFLKGLKIAEFVKAGSSLKICRIAEGRADIYPRLAPTCEWDIAAAHAVLNAAGGQLLEAYQKKTMPYGGKGQRSTPQDFLNPHFVAFGPKELV